MFVAASPTTTSLHVGDIVCLSLNSYVWCWSATSTLTSSVVVVSVRCSYHPCNLHKSPKWLPNALPLLRQEPHPNWTLDVCTPLTAQQVDPLFHSRIAKHTAAITSSTPTHSMYRCRLSFFILIFCCPMSRSHCLHLFRSWSSFQVFRRRGGVCWRWRYRIWAE